MHLELDLSGLDLGEVEDVVDEREQMVPEEVMSSRYSACFSFTEPTISSRNTLRTDDRIQRCRSSWDMLARNSDLC